ncbi:hypothetical protein Pmani_025579 [Petrolisthes manimaculis]|uniref:Uncharacterized protein n=1 Tax=Petrolisthes manimaculis TaxID=1843537 RepID=A0AAE1U116_9EUCA|nr:hypothetical protein Pmani_025579 [Petrolisthes manimaculis]
MKETRRKEVHISLALEEFTDSYESWIPQCQRWKDRLSSLPPTLHNTGLHSLQRHFTSPETHWLNTQHSSDLHLQCAPSLRSPRLISGSGMTTKCS